MMHHVININRNLIAITVTLALFTIIACLINTPSLFQVSKMGLAITIDLILVIPFVYFILIRKTQIPKTTVLPVIVVGLILGSYLLPEKEQDYLSLFKTWGLPFVELTAISLLIIKLRSARKKYDQLKNTNEDFFTTLKNTCNELLPAKVAMAFATEVAIFYYAFINWKKRELKSYEYSYHKDSGTIALMIVLLFIIGVETVVVHILLSKWSMLASWILTILSIYTVIQFLGIIKSILKRPIAIANGKLYLKYGMAKETTIDFNDIESIELSSKDIELNDETKKLALLGALEPHNVIVRLKKENTILGLYGIQSRFKTILLSIDNKTQFVEQLELGIANPELTEIK